MTLASRRYLPSISALLAFEAVARLGSATAAAEELSVTQSAVSRQIKTLEDQLDTALFARHGRALDLTETGRRYVREVRDILARLGSASVAAAAPSGGGTLSLAILPAFGTHWLAPRLTDFTRAAPGVTLTLATRLRPFDFRTERFDMAIHFGQKVWPGAQVRFDPLIPERVLPTVAPSRLAQAVTPTELMAHPLLHLESRPHAWSRWCAAHGLKADLPPGIQFDQFATMAEAAVHGLGIALLPDFVAAPHLDSGALIPATTESLLTQGQYWLVSPAETSTAAPQSAFRKWIAAASETVTPT